MSEIRKIDLYLLVSMENKQVFTCNDASITCNLDKSIVYKSIKVLLNANYLIKIESRPNRFVINFDELKKLRKNVKKN